jgi:hypothetical protein
LIQSQCKGLKWAMIPLPTAYLQAAGLQPRGNPP